MFYLRWLFARAAGGVGPMLDLGWGLKLGPNWNSFSEFWSTSRADWNHERAFLTRLRPLLGTSPVGIDVGANVGGFSVLMAALDFKKVHAFEPVVATAANMTKNLLKAGLSPRIVVNQLAVGNLEGEVSFWADPSRSGLCRMVIAGEEGTPVQCIRLDDYIARQKIDSVDFLKIDVEGFELLVLQGAKESLRKKRMRSILFEVCPFYLEHHGLRVAELIETLEQAGYSIWRVGPDGGLCSAARLEDLQNAICENFFATWDRELASALHGIQLEPAQLNGWGARTCG